MSGTDMSGTEIAYGNTTPCYATYAVLRWRMVLSGRGEAAAPSALFPYALATRCPVLTYRMSGTHKVYGAICLRACHAKSGTVLGYGAITLPA
eukprot:1191073-Rhodomonas_salina.2